MGTPPPEGKGLDGKHPTLPPTPSPHPPRTARAAGGGGGKLAKAGRSLALLRTGVLSVFQSPGEVELEEPGGDQPSPSPWHLSADLQAPVPEQRVPWASLRVPSSAQGRLSQTSATRVRVGTPGPTKSHFHFPSQAMGCPPPALRGSLQGLKVAQQLAPLLSPGPAPSTQASPSHRPCGAGGGWEGNKGAFSPPWASWPRAAGLWEP